MIVKVKFSKISPAARHSGYSYRGGVEYTPDILSRTRMSRRFLIQGIRYLCLAAVPGDGQYSDRDAVRCGSAPVRRLNNFAFNHGDHDAPSVRLSVRPSVCPSPDINARRSATLYPVKGSMTGSYKDCAQPT